MTGPAPSAGGRSSSAGTVLIQALHPPVRDISFWAVQVMVVILAGLHFYLDSVSTLEPTALPTGIPVALLLVPVLYSALRYGLAGAAATALWATLLWLLDLALPNALGHPADDLIDLAIVDAVAVFVGGHIERGLIQRRRAERAEKERREAELQYRELLHRERAQARSYAALLLAAQEEERRHIAHEIHDDPLQRLIHLARRLESLGAQPGPSPATAALREARLELLNVIGRLRDVARGLRPPGLDQLGLVAAVRGMLADVEDAHDLRVDFEVSGTQVRLVAEVELGAFRIIQEEVRNVTRHASAHALSVDLHYVEGAVRISVVDDGIGFDAPQGTYAPGVQLGLVGMRERASLLGGRLVVSSARGKGTAIEAHLPSAPSPTPVAG